MVVEDLLFSRHAECKQPFSSEYLLTEESGSAAAFVPEVLDSQKQLNLGEVMDDSKSPWGGGPESETKLNKGNSVAPLSFCRFWGKLSGFPHHLEKQRRIPTVFYNIV